MLKSVHRNFEALVRLFSLAAVIKTLKSRIFICMFLPIYIFFMIHKIVTLWDSEVNGEIFWDKKAGILGNSIAEMKAL